MANRSPQAPEKRPKRSAQAPKQAASRGTPKRQAGSAKEQPVAVLGGRLTEIVIALALLIIIVMPGSCVGNAVADVAYSGVRKVFDANPPLQTKPSTPAMEWEVGKTQPVSITLITADYSKLFCNSPEEIQGTACAFESDNKLRPTPEGAPLDDNKRATLQPYRTASNELLLVAGLWAEPHVAMRLHEEPPYSRNQDRLARFVANCQLEFIGVAKQAKLRWAPGGPWLDPDGQHLAKFGGVPVAIARSCEVQE